MPSFQSILSVLATVIVAVVSQCDYDFCPDGIETPDEVIDYQGNTCSDVPNLLGYSEEFNCTIAYAFELTCCPTSSRKCDFCPGGVTFPSAGVDLLGEGAEPMPCLQLDIYVQIAPIGFCSTAISNYTSTCCPDSGNSGTSAISSMVALVTTALLGYMVAL